MKSLYGLLLYYTATTRFSTKAIQQELHSIRKPKLK